MGKIKNTRFHVRLPIILALVVSAGFLFASLKQGNQPNKPNLASSYHKFANILQYVNQYYVDTVDTEELVETAITKMLEELDPHSVYIPPKEVELNKSQLTGNFFGIGIEFNIMRDTIYVVSPLTGGPSEKLGVRAGDRIVEVDGENVAGIGVTNRKVMEVLRGEKGTKVVVGINRNGKRLDFNIIRDKIPQNSVETAYMVNDKTGYIKVSRFSATTYDEFKAGLDSLTDKGMNRLVLDLQGNPGGYMEMAIRMADEFLNKDKLVVYTKGKVERHNQRIYSSAKGVFEKGSLIVLIDEGSASASEIVSGAIQDNDRGLIVGRRSFGKGLVQWPIPLNDGSELRLTISRYYTPSGRSIQKPYEKGLHDYYMDKANRFAHGEYFHADSIHLNDSLKYKTLKGRTVYGGGGIMPDYFVPLDTAYSSAYFNELVFYSNAFREYSINFYEKNEKKLKKMPFSDFMASYEVSDKVLDDLVKAGKKHDVEFDEDGFNKSKKSLKLRFKAEIARRNYGNWAFYPVINELNESFQRAMGLFDEADELAQGSD
ncbi:peptidase S41 [Fulvitalea axinellae]|uniref:Peptidase S41 n=1 Tax=Fulvitalea axinellae TaxID=1182444 RepID=A0AAU9DDS5_9BACT|nr:peptidase S41 [Fulvitalea axinellae]